MSKLWFVWALLPLLGVRRHLLGEHPQVECYQDIKEETFGGYHILRDKAKALTSFLCHCWGRVWLRMKLKNNSLEPKMKRGLLATLFP